MLQLIDISKTFNRGTVNEKTALSHLNLDVKDGDFITIIGSNGAGKSTMFNAICGTFFVDDGAVILDGQDITYEHDFARSKYIGHLFQDPMKGTAPHMSIEENLALAYLRASGGRGRIFSRVSKKEKELFREKLALLDMGLEDRIKNPAGLLSGGQRQALTLLLAHEPQYLQSHAAAGADLVFCGHAHGGQIRLPAVGGLFAPGQGPLPEYTAGLYQAEETTMLVSRGLGNSVFPLRVFNRPEITALTLRAEGA